MIRLEHLEKRFGERTVLRDLSLDIPRGQFAILFGPSGVGKTLLLSILAGLEPPTAGRVILDGRDMERVPPERRPVTMVFQRHALFPHLSVFENVAFSLRARGFHGASVRQRVAELLTLTGLETFADLRTGVLSGGQCQRVAFARALASDAEIILFDEPLNSLDRDLRALLMSELKRLHRARNFTALYVTHSVKEAVELGDRVYLLKDGHVPHTCEPREMEKHICTCEHPSEGHFSP